MASEKDWVSYTRDFDMVYSLWRHRAGIKLPFVELRPTENTRYESISEEEYYEAKEGMKPFDATLLSKYEQSETEIDLELIEACANGTCPIR